MIPRYSAKIGSEVEVRANQTSYRGILKAMSETEVYIKSVNKTWAIPLINITSMNPIRKFTNALALNAETQNSNAPSVEEEAPEEIVDLSELKS